MRATSSSSRTSCSASTTTATCTRASTPASTASAARRSSRRSELVDGKCPDHDIEPEWIEERNWFFRLSAYQDKLLAIYDERPDFVLPSASARTRRGASSRGGLQDFSISRAGQPWGVPIPWDPEQVAYVWADALVNYLSALTYARPGEDLRERYWPHVRHILAKDILRFHCVYWPALLLSAGYDVPKQLFVHGYLNLDNRKISKSLGNAVDPLDLVAVYGADAVRFWAIRSVPFGQDGNVLARDGARALRARARERPRQPRLADDGDDRPLPRRHPACRTVRRLGDQARARPARAATSRAGSTPSTSQVRSSGSGTSSERSTDTSRRRRRGRSRRTRRALPSSIGPSTTSSTAFAPSRSRWPRTCPRPRR